MIRKRLAGLYIAVFMMGSLLAQNESGTSAISMTLDDAVAFAWANTNSIKNASINIADAEQQIAQRLATGLPSINGSASFNRYIDVPVQVLPEQFVQLIQALNPGEEVSSEATFLLKNNFTAGINLDALIFDGSYFTALKASKRYRSYVQEEMLVEKQNLRYQVIDAYLPVLLIDENLKILELNLENLDKLLFESEQLYKEGFVEQLDVDRLALSKANLQIERENLLNQRAGAINLLKLVLNFPKEQELILTEVLTDLKTELAGEAITGDVNVVNRPEVNLAAAGLELQNLNVEVNQKAFWPTLRGLAVYQQSFQGNTFNDGFWAPTTIVGLNLNVPIFDGFGKKANVERARLDLEKATNQKVDLERSIQTEVTNARITYLNALRSLANQEKNIDLASRIYDTTQIKYKEGVGSSLELNQAEQSLYQTQSNYLQSLYDLVSARFDLQKALGN